ncbi:TCB2 [Hepatospora eriocheir]|uniref:TCB2 n=1 Tax=Hepatospora eriocheir TaxID=1081669 RepID=A0A1X0Q8E7_9MICR|nr:TCB2 [Hepatospora eriocheir]
MQDNDPKHTSRLVSNWLGEKYIQVLDWHPQTQNLNSIEVVWVLVKCKLTQFGKFKKDKLKEEIK